MAPNVLAQGRRFSGRTLERWVRGRLMQLHSKSQFGRCDLEIVSDCDSESGAAFVYVTVSWTCTVDKEINRLSYGVFGVPRGHDI